MVKKILVVIFAAIYITTSIGAVINIHYCMGKLTGWELGNGSSDICENCGMKEGDQKVKDDCCKNEQAFLKNHSDQKISETGSVAIQTIWVASNAYVTQTPTNIVNSRASKCHINFAAPRTQNLAIYLRNCLFLL